MDGHVSPWRSSTPAVGADEQGVVRARLLLIVLAALAAAVAPAAALARPIHRHHRRPAPHARATATADVSRLASGHSLAPGASLRSPDGRYRLTMQRDGDVVLVGPAGTLWHTGTAGFRGSSLVQERGGDLVVRGTEGQPLWISWTLGRSGASTVVRSDGTLAVVDRAGADLWLASTAAPAPAPAAPTPPPAPAGASVPACPSTPGAGDAVTRWRPVVRCVLGMLAQPRSDLLVADVLLVIAHESSGDPAAVNGWDANALRGDPSKGLMQVIGATFAAHRSAVLANDPLDPAANIYAGLHYAIARYGSIAAIPGVVRVAAGGTYVGYARIAWR